MGRLGRERPEVPLHVVAAQAGVGQALLRVNEVRGFHGVTHEEDRRVVTDEVVVAFSRISITRCTLLSMKLELCTST
jgi:hypothetical protein